MLCTAFASTVLAIKIVAAHLYKTIDSYLDKHDAQIMDLIKWAKENEKLNKFLMFVVFILNAISLLLLIIAMLIKAGVIR